MSTIALQLRESTRSAHGSAESHNFQKELASGLLQLPLFKAYLSQLYLVHQAFESVIRNQPFMGPVVTGEQMQAEILAADLRHLNIDPAQVKPLPVTAKMLARIDSLATTQPSALLGYHYVLLGSKHGGKFIAGICKKSYDLESGGCSYFDPYGPEFQKHWQHFTSGINEWSMTEEQISVLLDAAGEMFQYVEQLGGDLLLSMPQRESAH